jgi:DNA-binding transcriptional MerR regulator
MDKNQKTFSIGEVANLYNLSVPTLRYYDQIGLIPNLKRSSAGVRIFTQVNLEMIELIICLKSADMAIKDIKIFIDLGLQGVSTTPQRLEMLAQLRQQTEERLKKLQSTYQSLDQKYQYLQDNCPFELNLA